MLFIMLWHFRVREKKGMPIPGAPSGLVPAGTALRAPYRPPLALIPIPLGSRRAATASAGAWLACGVARGTVCLSCLKWSCLGVGGYRVAEFFRPVSL